jgi:PKHD-type hydroxylase
MFYQINSVLSAEDLQVICDEIKNIEFHDGRVTAGQGAMSAKNNLQAPKFMASAASGLAISRIKQNSGFNLIAAPLRISDLLLSKYEIGMEYGFHFDNPIMQSGKVRTDLAFTLFLDVPSTYEGGELIIEDGNGPRSFKPDAGSMIIYPASFLHRVAPIRAGQRRAIVGWVQSFIRDPQHRAILYDLSRVRTSLSDKDNTSSESGILGKSISNLIRMWSEN